jgi:hypothetical protein
MHSTADYPWEALCTDLNGTGVWSLDEALAKFKLRPVHQALHSALNADVLRCYSDLIEAEAGDTAAPVTRANQAPCSREETLAALEKTAERFFRAALESPHLPVAPEKTTEPIEPTQNGHVTQSTSKSGEASTSPDESKSPVESESEASAPSTPAIDSKKQSAAQFARTAAENYHHLLVAASKLPSLERAFAHGWPPEARHVLPSYSPQTTAVVVWAPVVAWCLLRAFADTLPPDQNTGEIFDRLYLRSSLADAFQPLGLEGEAAYRAAARVRILITRPRQPEPASVPQASAWEEPDIVWFTGLHEAQGHRYFNKESHEQLLWWSALPDLIATAEKDPAAKSPATQKILQTFEQEAEAAITAAANAGYRLDKMLKPSAIAEAATEEVPTPPSTAEEPAVSVSESAPTTARNRPD